MNTYLAASDVKLTMPIVDGSGNAVTPIAASYRVQDENGTDVVALSPVTMPGAGGTSGAKVVVGADGSASVVVSIPAALNGFTQNMLRGMRRVDVTVDTGAGQVLFTQSYLLEGGAPLVPGTNSFQTFDKAELVALDIPNLDGYKGATREERLAALIQARLNLGQMRYRYRWSQNWQNFIFPEFAVYSVIQLTQAQYMTLPIDFRQAIERAQILEADDLLGGDPVLAKRTQGIVSETIGTSTTTFSSVRPAHQLICPRAMHCMARYVVKRIRVAHV
jgi:hypothetical protein